MKENIWLKIFLVIMEGTWRLQKLVHRYWWSLLSNINQPEAQERKFMLTWFSDIIPKVWSRLLTILCQCIFDACCFATIFEWIFLDDPLADLDLVDLGAYKWHFWRYHYSQVQTLEFFFISCLCQIITCMHKFKNGLISFFKLSRIIPYIFSRYAVRCCLKSKAGYLGSTFECVFGFPTIPL